MYTYIYTPPSGMEKNVNSLLTFWKTNRKALGLIVGSVVAILLQQNVINMEAATVAWSAVAFLTGVRMLDKTPKAGK